MTVTYLENDATRTIEVTVSGHISRVEYDDVSDRMQRFIDRHQIIKFIEVVDDLDGFDPAVIWPGIKIELGSSPAISHVAIVSDIDWIAPLTKATGAFFSPRLRTFPRGDLHRARSWINGA